MNIVGCRVGYKVNSFSFSFNLDGFIIIYYCAPLVLNSKRSSDLFKSFYWLQEKIIEALCENRNIALNQKKRNLCKEIFFWIHVNPKLEFHLLLITI